MAETPSSSDPQKRGSEFWAIATLGVTALICFGLMTVGLALIFTRSTPPSIVNSPVVNVGTTAAAVVTPTGIHRPEDVGGPRTPLPAGLGQPIPQEGVKRKIALTRGDPPSPPSPASVDPRKVYFRVRAQPTSFYPGSAPLPMPERYNPDLQGNVKDVFASREPGKADERFSYAPDVVFAESGVRGQSLDLQLTQPRKTSAVDGFRAPKGFQFFTAKLHIGNQGAQPVVLRVDDLEVHDADGLRYLANPELVVGTWPAPSLAPAGEVEVELSFLVPEGSPLKELAVQEAPGQMALVPLQAR